MRDKIWYSVDPVNDIPPFIPVSMGDDSEFCCIVFLFSRGCQSLIFFVLLGDCSLWQGCLLPGASRRRCGPGACSCCCGYRVHAGTIACHPGHFGLLQLIFLSSFLCSSSFKHNQSQGPYALIYFLSFIFSLCLLFFFFSLPFRDKVGNVFCHKAAWLEKCCFAFCNPGTY